MQIPKPTLDGVRIVDSPFPATIIQVDEHVRYYVTRDDDAEINAVRVCRVDDRLDRNVTDQLHIPRDVAAKIADAIRATAEYVPPELRS